MKETADKRVRTCVGCGEQFDKNELLRIVRNPDGSVSFDPSGRAAGRGAYVCSLGCLETAEKTKGIQRALHMDISQEVLDRIALEIVDTMR